MSDTPFVASAVLSFAVAAVAVGGSLSTATRAESGAGEVLISQAQLEPELAAPGARGEGLEGAEPASSAAEPGPAPFARSAEPLLDSSTEPTAIRTVARSKVKRPQIEPEDAWVGNLHRMQVPFPEHNVVVCLAGCSRGKESIVYFKKRERVVARRGEVHLGAMSRPAAPLIRVASSEPAPAAPSDERVATSPDAPPAEPPIACVAGCYGDRKTFNGRRQIDIPDVRSGRVVDGVWLTGVGPSGASAPVVTRYNRSRGARKDTSSDWFTKRF